jgi:sterol desaturase/sphingolipid hydroxylase (fatty acid hydroxylase superfamily)
MSRAGTAHPPSVKGIPMNDLPNIMVAALPMFFLLVVVEYLVARRTGAKLYLGRDTTANFALAAGAFVMSLLTAGAMFAFLSLLYSWRVFTLPETAWWVWALCFFADDISYYWFHRFSHEVRWFWASHSVHHSSQEYNFSVSLRQTWTGTISGAFLFWAWMPLVGFPPKMILFMQSVSLIYQFWIHTRTIRRMPAWFEAVFNTPSHHRVHHASDFEYLDRNYAGTLIVWDRLFGTWSEEKSAPRFGLTKNIDTFNPVGIAFHEWRHIVADLGRAHGLRHALGVLFMPPGWSPDDSTLTTRQARAAADTPP